MGAFGYFAVLFGAAYGWLIWDESITFWLIAGSVLIAIGGLLAGRSSQTARGEIASAQTMTDRSTVRSTGSIMGG